jgi:hypothetical protein
MYYESILHDKSSSINYVWSIDVTFLILMGQIKEKFGQLEP